ncbi:MAG: SRPBCC family protein [Candidatus Dormiibacterota bacterium]
MGKERSISASATIDASPDQVWEVLNDMSRYPEWVESTLKMVRTDGTARLNATYEELTRISGPWKAVTRWRITEFDSPRRQVHAGEGIVTASGMSLVLEITPIGEGTQFTSTIRYTPRFGILGAVIDRATEAGLTRAQQRSARVFAALVAREASSH